MYCDSKLGNFNVEVALCVSFLVTFILHVTFIMLVIWSLTGKKLKWVSFANRQCICYHIKSKYILHMIYVIEPFLRGIVLFKLINSAYRLKSMS